MTSGVLYCDVGLETAGKALFIKAKEVLSRGWLGTAGAHPVSDNAGPRRGRTGEQVVGRLLLGPTLPVQPAIYSYEGGGGEAAWPQPA